MASKNGAGRPAFDKMAIIDELKRRYPNGSEFTSADDLFAANPDLLPRMKTLKNNAKDLFGMPLGKYLTSIGLLKSKSQSKGENEFDYEGYLNEFALEIKRRLHDVEYIPDAVTKLPSSFGDMDFKLARRCIKKIYADTKTLDQYLQDKGVLCMSTCVLTLKNRRKICPRNS